MSDDQREERKLAREQAAVKTAWLGSYEGLGLDEAKARAEAEGRRCRVIGPGTAVTLDLRLDRLNLYVDADGNLTGMRGG
jgi:hypothetical protein